MDSYKETFNTWNKVASLYEEKFMYFPIYNETYDAFCNELREENALVLEVGCGPGNISKYVIAKRNDIHLMGIDVAPNMIELARKNNPQAQFEVMDCREIKKLQSPFDAIISGFCIPYLSPEDCRTFIRDCVSILKTEGLFYLSFVEGDPNQSGFQTSSSGDRCFFCYFDTNALENELAEQKLEIIQSFGIAYQKTNGTEVHRVFIARKLG